MIAPSVIAVLKRDVTNVLNFHSAIWTWQSVNRPEKKIKRFYKKPVKFQWVNHCHGKQVLEFLCPNNEKQLPNIEVLKLN